MQLRGAAARQALLRAAHDLLSSTDAGIPSLEAIAQRAGVTRATLYKHFQGRARLIDALLSELVAEHAMDQLLTRTRALPPAQALDSAVATCASFWSSERHLLRRLFAADLNEPGLAVDLRRREEWRYDQFVELIGRLRPAGAVPTIAGAVVALTSFATWDQLAERLQHDPTTVRTLQLAAASALRLDGPLVLRSMTVEE